MARKRAPGAGRKPMGEIQGKSSAFSTRIRPETRKKLETAARANGRSLSQEVERRLIDLFGIQKEQNPYLRALFYLMTKAAGLLAPKWQEDPWGRQAFKAAAIATLNRHIQNKPCKAPQKIKDGWPDVTAEAYGKQLEEWGVNLFVIMTPDETPSEMAVPSGSVVYTMRQVRRDLGIPHDEEMARLLLNKLGEPPTDLNGEKK